MTVILKERHSEARRVVRGAVRDGNKWTGFIGFLGPFDFYDEWWVEVRSGVEADGESGGRAGR